jgi:hypothetical protein
LFIEAHRLEAFIPARVGAMPAPDYRAAGWWCACTARGDHDRCVLAPKDETMSDEQAQANPEIAFDSMKATQAVREN